MPKVIPTERWELGADLYAKGGSLAGIARALGVSVTAVRRHRDEGGWTRGDMDTADAVTAAFAEEQTQPISDTALDPHTAGEIEADNRVAELERALEEEKARTRVLAEKVEDQSTVREVHLYSTPQEVEDYYGKQRIDDMVAKEFGSLNLERTKQGLPRIDPQEVAPEAYRETRERILADFVARRTKWVDPSARVRVVKMWNPHTKAIWQCPVEDQFNNEKMFRGAAVLHYKNKGHKLISPYMCQRLNCHAFAAVEAGQMKYHGYCTPQHLQDDPYITAAAKAGVAGSGQGAVA